MHGETSGWNVHSQKRYETIGQIHSSLPSVSSLIRSCRAQFTGQLPLCRELGCPLSPTLDTSGKVDQWQKTISPCRHLKGCRRQQAGLGNSNEGPGSLAQCYGLHDLECGRHMIMTLVSLCLTFSDMFYRYNSQIRLKVESSCHIWSALVSIASLIF